MICWHEGKDGFRAFVLVDEVTNDLVFPKFCPDCGINLREYSDRLSFKENVVVAGGKAVQSKMPAV